MTVSDEPFHAPSHFRFLIRHVIDERNSLVLYEQCAATSEGVNKLGRHIMQATTDNAATFPGAMRTFPTLNSGESGGSKITSATKRNRIIYWAITGFMAFGMLSQGFAQVFMTKGFVEMIVSHLGYPSYLLYIIGVWKILGVIAILIPGFRLLKEWAYAGFFFVMSGALFSHIASRDPLTASLPAFLLLALIVISWYFRPADRKII